jgi:hypothetical protein
MLPSKPDERRRNRGTRREANRAAVLRPRLADETMNVRRLGELVRKAVWAWIDDGAQSMGAALAYYTVFSIAPLLIIVIAVAGFVLDGTALVGHPERWLDFGSRSTHEMTVAAKTLVQAFYGQPARYSYSPAVRLAATKRSKKRKSFPTITTVFLAARQGTTARICIRLLCGTTLSHTKQQAHSFLRRSWQCSTTPCSPPALVKTAALRRIRS